MGDTGFRPPGLTVSEVDGTPRRHSIQELVFANTSLTVSGSKATIDILSVGGPISGGTANRILYQDSSNQLAQSDNLVFDGTNMTLGSGAAGIDYTLTFDGENNDGVITWLEDEDAFRFQDDLLMASSEALAFRDAQIFINSAIDGHLDLTADISIDLNGLVTSTAGKVKNTTRVTSTYTILITDDQIFLNTDSGGFTATLPAGVDGQTYRIIASGTSGNSLTLSPDGLELLLGVNSNLSLSDGNVLVITYQTTEGWY